MSDSTAGNYGTFTSFMGRDSSNTAARSTTPFSNINKMLADLLNNKPNATNPTVTENSGANNAFLNSNNTRATGGDRSVSLLTDIKSTGRAQVSAAVSLYRALQASTDKMQQFITEAASSNKINNEQLHKIATLLASGENNSGGISIGGRGGFMSRNASRMGRIGGRLLAGAAIAGGGYEAYNSLSNLSNQRGTPLLGNEQTGGFFGSRLANYGSTMASGATMGAGIGSLFGGVGAVPGAAIGAGLGLGAGLIADYGPDIGNATHTAANSVKEGLSQVWDAVSGQTKKQFADILKNMPKWETVSNGVSSLVGTVAEFISKISKEVSGLITEAYDWIWKQIPSWNDIQQQLGFGPRKPGSGEASGVAGGGIGGPGDTLPGLGNTYGTGTARENAPTGGRHGSFGGNSNRNIDFSADGLSGSNLDRNSVAGAIAGGESRGGQLGIFNGGAGNNYRQGHIDAENTTLEEVMRRQNLAQNDPNRIFAAGRYQVIPDTMRDAVNALHLDPHSTKFNEETQNRIFTDYLMDQKRPQVSSYIRGTSNDIDAAHHAVANEFASVAYNGRSVYDQDGVNHSSVSDDRMRASLQQARQRYQELRNSGMSESQAYRQAVLGIQNTTKPGDKPGNTATATNPNAVDPTKPVDPTTPATNPNSGLNAANQNTTGALKPTVDNRSPTERFGFPQNPNDRQDSDRQSFAAASAPHMTDAQVQEIAQRQAQAAAADTTPVNSTNVGNDSIENAGNAVSAATNETQIVSPQSMTNSNDNNNTSNDNTPAAATPAAASGNSGGGMQRSSNKSFDGADDFGLNNIPMHILGNGLILVNSGSTQ